MHRLSKAISILFFIVIALFLIQFRSCSPVFNCISISGEKPFYVFQTWEKPLCSTYETDMPLIVGGVRYQSGIRAHAVSVIKFRLPSSYSNSDYAAFQAVVGVPDYAKGSVGSVVFQVYGDKTLLWQSKILHGGESEPVKVDIRQRRLLELHVTDAGDGIDFDHAYWMNLELKR